MNMHSTFINYRRDDAGAEAKLVADALRSVAGKNAIFMDAYSIEPGAAWPDRIHVALKASRHVVAVIGPDWLRAGVNEWGQRRIDDESDWVRRELAATLANREQILIPVLVRGGRIPPKAVLPSEIAGLSDRKAIELRRDYWDHDIQVLQTIIIPNQSSGNPNARTSQLTPLDQYWDLLDPALQDAFALAANSARREGKDIISTRTIFAALRRLHPGELSEFFSQIPSEALPAPLPASLAVDRESLDDIRVLSSCVQDSLNNLTPQVNEKKRLTSEDMFVDIARHGQGYSVHRLRTHGVDEARIDVIVRQLGWSVLDRDKTTKHNKVDQSGG